MTINDIIEITRLTDRYNFHSHTQYCDGRFTMDEFARAAVESGFEHYGFSPHSPVPVSSGCNMSMDKVEEYLNECGRIKREYAQRTCFYAGMEIDYIGSNWGPSHPYFQSLPLDYRIGSVHFIPAQDGKLVDVDGSFVNFNRKMSDHFHNDIEWVVRKFYSSTVEMIDAGGFDIIGHFDKIGHNASHFRPGIEDEGWYCDLVQDVIGRIEKSGLIVEINTKAREVHGRFFPNVKWWGELKRKGIPMVVNSDAHYIDLINASRNEALALLRQ